MGQGGNAGGRPTQTARHARTCSNRFHTAKGVPQRAPPLPPTPTRPTLRRNTDRREHPGLAGRSRRRTTTTAASLITTPGPSRPKRRRTTRGQGRPAGPDRRRTTEGGLTRPRRRRTTRGQGRPAGPERRRTTVRPGDLTRPRRRRTTRGQGRPAGPERRRTTVGLGGDARGKPPRPALRPRPTPAPRRRLGRRVGGRPTRHSRRGPGRHDRWGVSASRSPRRKLAQSGPAPLRPDRMEDWGRRSRSLMRRSLRPFQIHAHGGGTRRYATRLVASAPARSSPRSSAGSTHRSRPRGTRAAIESLAPGLEPPPCAKMSRSVAAIPSACIGVILNSLSGVPLNSVRWLACSFWGPY